MRHPTYHLRPNKTADRLAFIEAIKRLERLGGKGLSDYTYHGLGGPYLEDFRLLYEFCPEIGMVSIENDQETYKRQSLHLPCSKLKLINDDLSAYISRYNRGDTKSVFWLDYTRLEYRYFEDFKALLATVAEGSMVKVTLRCEPRDYWVPKQKNESFRKADKFRAEFANVMVSQAVELPRSRRDFARLLQGMLRVAVEQAFPPAATKVTFVPVSSFYYSDGTGMLTLTGVVYQRDRRSEVKRVFSDWELANLTWSRPKLISVPFLSTQERLHLQHLLPSSSATVGRTLRETLGYLIDDSIRKTETALEQYATFHRYAPYILRGVP